MTDENLSEISHRSIPPSLGAVIGELEFRGEAVVSGAKIAEYAELAAGSPTAYGLIRRLVAARWLRPLGVQGYYEFIPGAAGPYSRNDDFDPLRAFLGDPGTGQVISTSAASLHDLTDRVPMHLDVAIPRARSVWKALRDRYRFHRVRPERLFGAERVKGVPASARERLLIDVALWPDVIGPAIRDRDHWLAAALDGMEAKVVIAMLDRLGSPTTTARTGYLAAVFGRPDIADAVAELPRSRVTVRLLPRTVPTATAARDHRFNVSDPVGAATIS